MQVVSRVPATQCGLVAGLAWFVHHAPVRILFFAQLCELTGVSQADLEVDGIGATALWAVLEERWPALSGQRANTRLARNGAYARPDEIFTTGDEVALIPPVSGG
jgi:molybdopterin synthase sulfur carrier subunit